jgi:hypothetical protein
VITCQRLKGGGLIVKSLISTPEGLGGLGKTMMAQVVLPNDDRCRAGLVAFNKATQRNAGFSKYDARSDRLPRNCRRLGKKANRSPQKGELT